MGSERTEHLVVLMLENRSFDHMLGFLDHPKGGEFDGLRSGRHVNQDSTGTEVEANDGGEPYGLDPDHSHAGAVFQMGTYRDVTSNGGFVVNHEATLNGDVRKSHEIMACLHPSKVPVLSTLALEFAVCTRWFCSVPGATWPNRNFAHAATSDGTVDIDFGFYRDPTVFEALEVVGKSWRIYYDGPPQVWFYHALWKPRLRDLRPGGAPRIRRWRRMHRFFDDVARGELATYTFIEPAHNTLASNPFSPRRTNSQHPHNNRKSPAADFEAGEALIRDVYEALRANEELFDKTLLVITYDEHGGLYDHVPPPKALEPGDPIQQGLLRRLHRALRRMMTAVGRIGRPKAPSPPPDDFPRLGFRVPAVLISPWIPRHTIVPTQLEHASIPRTLGTLHGFKPLTRRDKRAGCFHEVVTESTLTSPRRTGAAEQPLPQLPVVRVADAEPAGPSEGELPEPDGDLDQELAALTSSVERRLRWNLAAIVLRSRRGRPGLGSTGLAWGMNADELFAETAESARTWTTS